MSDEQGLFNFDAAVQAGEDGAAVAWERSLEEWRDEALRFIRGLPTGAWLTADDIVRAVGLPSSDGRNNAMGALFKVAQSRKWIRSTREYRRSERVTRHANAVAVWERLFIPREEG